MPPKNNKKAALEVEAAPPPPPPDPAVVAAQELVGRWEERKNELVEKVGRSQVQIKELIAQKTERENEMKELQSKVQELAQPKPPEPTPTKTPAKPAKGKSVDPPPPPPIIDEEEQKKVQKNTTLLLNGFKKKKEKPITKTVVIDGENQTVVEEAPLPKPTDIDPTLWSQMLELREKRFSNEETISTMRSNIETLTARRDTLQEMHQLAQYALEAAQFELKRLQESKGGAPLAPADGGIPVTAATLSALPPTAPPKSPGHVVRGK